MRSLFAESLKTAINDHMFDEKDGIYYSLDIAVKTNQKYIFHRGLGVCWKGLPIKIRFWACFLPMAFGISDERQSRLLVKHITDESVSCAYGIRTLAKDEKMFNEEIQTNYIYDAHKPSIKNYQKAMEIMGTDLKSTIFVGDQLFTDVWGAKRTGIRNILVKPIHPKEEIQIVLKRRLEWIVLWFYKRQNKK